MVAVLTVTTPTTIIATKNCNTNKRFKNNNGNNNHVNNNNNGNKNVNNNGNNGKNNNNNHSNNNNNNNGNNRSNDTHKATYRRRLGALRIASSSGPSNTGPLAKSDGLGLL